jgi:phosphoenolpyruvate carboxykinase (GTP)
VLEWVFNRVTGKADAIDTPIGWSPGPDAIDIAGLDVSAADMAELLRVDTDEWRAEVPSIREHYAQFGDRLPAALADEVDTLERNAWVAAAAGCCPALAASRLR